MPGTLFVVATPLGNLRDVTLRALEVLKQVDWIACEDTRHSAKLLRHFNIQTPCLSYHEHNEKQRSRQLVARLKQGQSGVLISDAGTPLISDPGYELVRLCRQEGIGVAAVPGPSAAIAALSISGLPSDSFLFAGFPPRKTSEARRFFESWESLAATLIFFLSPHRLSAELAICHQVLGAREAFLIREMTKLHEESWWGSLEDLTAQIQEHTPRGEYTLVVAAGSSRSVQGAPIDVEAYVHGLLQLRGMDRKLALKTAAEELGMSRNQLYRLLIGRED